MSDTTGSQRLSKLEAAWVIARRDFIAVLFSRAFLFFLLGPLFPVIVGGLAGSIGKQNSTQAVSIEIGLAMSAEDNAAMLAARAALADELGRSMPDMEVVPEAAGEADFNASQYLEDRRGDYAAIVSGTLAAPQLVGTEAQLQRWQGAVGLITAAANQQAPTRFPDFELVEVTSSAASDRIVQTRTAGAAQMVLFLLTMLLAGMVLSNFAEEKGNKVIEILAAALPLDSVFTGKLFAMLGVSFVGIAVWGVFGWAFWAVAEDAIVTVTQTDFRTLAGPAIGWPMFLALGVIYFSMAYLLLGALFLTVGAMASTVREVQTLSMPVTMMQLMVFFISAYAISQPGSALETFALSFPLSSPFAMLARAAMDDTLWVHAAALLWQALWVAILVKGGSILFRKRVMKSGGAGHAKKQRKWFGARKDATAEPAE